MPPSKGYTFGMKLPDISPKPSTTPGPLDYSTSCLTRFGKLTSPAYTIKSKGTVNERKPATTPGPLDYHTTDLFKQKPSKSYSFGQGTRNPFQIKADTPPPNKYTVPSTIGSKVPDKKLIGGAFSMQGRQKHSVQKSVTPGPGAYDTVSINVYKKKEPAIPFTGHKRSPFTPADPHIPGPSQYNTLDCNIDRIKGRCAPRVPFGIRHSNKKFTVFTKADIMY